MRIGRSSCIKYSVIALFALSLGLFSIPSYAIADDYYTLPSWDDVPHEDEVERNTRILKESAKSDWKRIIRSQPEVFDMTIDGKTRECYYEGKNIICE